MESLTKAELKTHYDEVIAAIELIEQRLPGYQVRLFHEENAGNGAQRNGHVKETRSNRQRVADAARGKALSITELAAETGLEKSQIRGVLNALSETDNYERTDQPDGSKLYKYVGK